MRPLSNRAVNRLRVAIETWLWFLMIALILGAFFFYIHGGSNL
jgi:hypothetical protein